VLKKLEDGKAKLEKAATSAVATAAETTIPFVIQ